MIIYIYYIFGSHLFQVCSGLWLASVFVNHSTIFGCFVFGFGGRNSCWIKSLLFWVNTFPLSLIPGIQLLLLLSSFNRQALNWTKWNYCLCFLLWHINSKNTLDVFISPKHFPIPLSVFICLQRFFFLPMLFYCLLFLCALCKSLGSSELWALPNVSKPLVIFF